MLKRDEWGTRCRRFERFNMSKLKHVDSPTTLITDDIRKFDPRENAFAKGLRGDYGYAVQRGASRLSGKYPLSAVQDNLLRQLAHMRDSEVATSRAPIPDNPKILSYHIKCLGYFLGADIIGICQVPQYAMYECDIHGNPIDIYYKYAIMIVVAQDYQTTRASTGHGWMGNAMAGRSHLLIASIANTISNYIRKLGHAASPQYSPYQAGGYQVIMPPLLLWAGIGEMSRAGIILNPFLGMNFKAGAVLTNLSLQPDKPIDFGLQDFCRNCKICAEECPSKAISMGDKIMHNGYETWKLNEELCCNFSFLKKRGTICGLCLKVCPWTKPNGWLYNIFRQVAQRSNLGRRLIIKASNIWQGQRQAHEEGKWWFDLEEVDGILRIPP